MARGFGSAPGASAEMGRAQSVDLDKAGMLVLGTSRNVVVRAAIAERLDCPFGLMVTLAHDYSAEVRAAVASNARAQRSVFDYLAGDRSVLVVLALIANPALPEEILEDLAFHKKSDVRAAAARRLDTGAPGVLETHAEDEHTPELADHVSLAGEGEWRFVGDGWLASTQALPTDHDDASGAIPAAAHVAQFFSPAPGQESVLATRTAPVRGFRAPEE